MNQGGNYWTLFTPGIWKVLHAVFQFEAQMNAAGVDWRIILYGGVLHAFTVAGAADYGMAGLRYDRTADERSWRAMLDLFKESIGRPALG